MQKIIFYLALFIIILVFSMNAASFDADLWARLIAGMGFVDGGHVLTQDFLSYTPVHTWYDHEWGAGVIFYFCLKYFGTYSLIILQALMIFGIFFFISKIIELKSDKPYNILFYLFAIMSVMPAINIPVRCHLFSFLFFTIFIYILEKVRLGNKKLLIIIPILTLLWGNIHGGVVSGIGLLVMYTIGEALNKKSFKEYLITFIISALTLFINPWGYEYVQFLLMANTMQRPNIVEWYGIFSKIFITKYILFKLFILFTIITEIVYLAKTEKKSFKDFYNNLDKTKFIILLSTLYLAIIHLKLISFFAICACCFAYNDFYELIKSIKLPVWKDKFVYLFIFILFGFSIFTKNYSLPVNFQNYPVKEVEFIKINKLSGNILTNFGYGSFVAYKLYPQNKIFMDGRYEEVYDVNLINEMRDLFLADNDNLLKKYKTDFIIIEKFYPLYNKLKSDKNYFLAYESEKFALFLKEKYKEYNFIMPEENNDYYNKEKYKTLIDWK